MCILFFAIKQHPNYPLIICANRDEFHQRPTQPAHYWQYPKDMLAGKDLEAGGSWLAINKNANFAAITNIRTAEVNSKNKKSRGELVTKVFEEDSVVNEQWLVKNSNLYKPFNLIYGSLDKLYCYNSSNKTQIQLCSGFHAVSNGAMDDVWPKMNKGEKNLERVVTTKIEIVESDLLSILKDSSQPDDPYLPDTGIPSHWEKLLSSIFICSDDYGTRSSNLIIVRDDSNIEFIEAVYDNQGHQTAYSRFDLSGN